MDQGPWQIRFVRSSRRIKTVSARLLDGVVEIRVPDGLSARQEEELAARLVARLRGRHSRARPGDDGLMARAQELNRKHFDGKLQIDSVRYVPNQRSRFGSCTPSSGCIRLSDRLRTLPDWVRDYVLIHEMAHLVEANHSPGFWGLVNRYPLSERAMGFLMGWEWCGPTRDEDWDAGPAF